MEPASPGGSNTNENEQSDVLSNNQNNQIDDIGNLFILKTLTTNNVII